MPKISIIMPVFNKEKYVFKSIQSVLDQSFRDFELIIINDGSTDDSLKICKEFTNDDRIRLFSIENGGVSRARNFGLKKSKGQYVLFIDADDYIEVEFLQSMLSVKSQCVIGGITKVSKNNKVINQIVPKYNGKYAINEILSSFYKEQQESGIYGYIASKLVLKEIIDKFHIQFNEKITLAEDYDFFLSVYEHVDEIGFTTYSGYNYVQETENSAMRLDDRKVDFFDQISIQKKAYNVLNKSHDFSESDYNMYLQILTGYVYTIFIKYSYFKYNNFCSLFKKIKDEVPLIDRNCFGLMKICMFLYEKNLKLVLYLLLKIKLYIGRINI